MRNMQGNQRGVHSINDGNHSIHIAVSKREDATTAIDLVILKREDPITCSVRR
jgi:hypothetical protein